MGSQTRYSVIGLGKLGASMVAALASRGFEVTGVDVNPEAVAAVKAGHAPVYETGLGELIARHQDRICATLSHAEAIHNSEVTFVVVPTPSDAQGAFSLQYAAEAFRAIGRALAEKAGYHLVVLTSTVLPGSMRHGLLPILEQQSGKTCGADFGLCYSPEFIALGSVIHDFLNPDFTLVGEFDARAGDRLQASYAEIVQNGAHCQRMSFENAELAKIALNSYVTMKITFANMVAELCEQIPGGDVDAVTRALGFDERIGAKYLKGGLGYGGPCFPRDNVALGYMARALGLTAALTETTDRVNRAWPAKWAQQVAGWVQPGQTVGVLGLAYKPASHVIEESQSVEVARALASRGLRVVAYDPLAGSSARAALQDGAVIVDSLADCLAQAQVVVITTPDPEFRALKAADFGATLERPVTVIDFWRLLKDELKDQPGLRYVALGQSAADTANGARLRAIWNDKLQSQATESGRA